MNDTSHDFDSLALLITLAAAINLSAAVKDGKDPVPTVFANVVLFLCLALVGSLFRYDVVKGLAALYLLASFLRAGSKVVDILVSLAVGVAQTGGSK